MHRCWGNGAKLAGVVLGTGLATEACMVIGAEVWAQVGVPWPCCERGAVRGAGTGSGGAAGRIKEAVEAVAWRG